MGDQYSIKQDLPHEFRNYQQHNLSTCRRNQSIFAQLAGIRANHRPEYPNANNVDCLIANNIVIDLPININGNENYYNDQNNFFDENDVSSSHFENTGSRFVKDYY